MAKRGTLDSYTKKIVKKYAAALKKAGVPVSGMYVYGSRAKGLAGKWSDIDICVISPKFGKDSFDETVYLNRIAVDVDPIIEAVAYSPRDFAIEEDPFAYEIKTSGYPFKF